jgi:glyoxylase-like metal-dependent hydrolase (beta-lactamase superfamily II)
MVWPRFDWPAMPEPAGPVPARSGWRKLVNGASLLSITRSGTTMTQAHTGRSRLFRLAALAMASLLAASAQASAPQVRTQAPGYYRMMVGDIEVTALSDGTVNLPVDKLLTHTTEAQVNSALTAAYQKAPLETSVNGFLVNTGTHLVLVDTGAGGMFGPTLGKLADSLRAAGYRPDQVDEIYITHFHADHVGGLVADGKAVYPNAVVRADQREADFWLSAEHLEAAPEAMKGFFKAAQTALGPYVAAGHFKPFKGDTELTPGVRAQSTPGHTAGHSFYVVESKGQKLVLWGDLMHVAAVQFPDPAVTIQFDTDSDQALAQRRKAFADAAHDGFWVAGAHLAFPGVGHLRSSGNGYTWVPANYSSQP